MKNLCPSPSRLGLLCFLLFTSSNKDSLRLVVDAYVSRSPSQCSRSRSIASNARYFGTKSSSKLSVSTDEDINLDAALDDLFSMSDDENAFFNEPDHIKDSRPLSSILLEEDDPIDFHDPEFLNTKNPRWVQAGLSPAVIDVLSEKGITHFTPVQGEAFSPVLARRDVIGRSRTGTGKTLAFGMPALTRLIEFTEEHGTRVNGRMQRGRKVAMLVLCPTRELAKQVQEELAQIAKPLSLFTTCFHGGVSYDPQTRALRNGIDVLVGTPGRVIDHLNRGTLDLSECDCVVLDEADEMLNMGFAEDVEVILDGLGSGNPQKAQCLLFSATTPPWVKEIGEQYQDDVLSIDATSEEGGARVAKTVRHCAVQVPPGIDSKKAILEDIIAVEISKESSDDEDNGDEDDENESGYNPIAEAAKEKKQKTNNAMQQKIFGKTIVFTQTKKDADELVSTGVFKSLTAQAIHGDVGQKQRDATLNAFRRGAFNVLVATDVAARGIDIQDVDLVVQLDPPRDVDTYVHRSGRTGRAGNKGISVLLFDPRQARDIVKIERELGYGFKFDLVGPPSIEAAMRAAAKTSANACMSIPDETAAHFKEAAASLLEEGNDAEDIIARCLAAISRRSTSAQSRSLLTGEVGLATVEMAYPSQNNRYVKAGDVMFTVGKLARMSQRDNRDLTFVSDIGKITTEKNAAMFDMSVDDAKKLIEFSKDIDAGGADFKILQELEIKRDRFFGQNRRFDNRNGGRGGGGGRGGRYGGNNGYQQRGNYQGGYRRPFKSGDRPHLRHDGGGGRYNGGGGGGRYNGGGGGGNGGGGYRGRGGGGGGRRYDGGGGGGGRRYSSRGGGDNNGW